MISFVIYANVAIAFPKHNRVHKPIYSLGSTVAWRPAVAFLRGEGRSAGFSETPKQYAYQSQHLVCRLLGPHCREWRGTSKDQNSGPNSYQCSFVLHISCSTCFYMPPCLLGVLAAAMTFPLSVPFRTSPRARMATRPSALFFRVHEPPKPPKAAKPPPRSLGGFSWRVVLRVGLFACGSRRFS